MFVTHVHGPSLLRRHSVGSSRNERDCVTSLKSASAQEARRAIVLVVAVVVC